jgi:transketolase
MSQGFPPGLALREAFWSELAEVMPDHPRVVVLDGDLANSTRADLVEERVPDRFIQMGIAEQNMLGVAAGLAAMGWLPYVSSLASFAVSRALDPIRVLIAQPGLSVKIIGGYSGLLIGTAGKTHQEVEDVAVMRAMPGMTVLAPADEHEARGVVRALLGHRGPAYVRLTRNPSPQVFRAGLPFRIGPVAILREGTDVTMFSTGVQSVRALEAAGHLAERGISAHVVHVPTLKPLDTDGVVSAASRTGRVVTTEDHSVIGGLGSAIAEVLSSASPMRIERLGIQDMFGESGSDPHLAGKYGLSAEFTAAAVEEFVGQTPPRRVARGNGRVPGPS